jgi:hypothetical protein
VGTASAGGGANGSTNSTGLNGTANLGGGAGGYFAATNTGGSNGGSGIVIISYVSATQRGTGGTVTSSGGSYIHTFTSSGTYTA